MVVRHWVLRFDPVNHSAAKLVAPEIPSNVSRTVEVAVLVSYHTGIGRSAILTAGETVKDGLFPSDI